MVPGDEAKSDGVAADEAPGWDAITAHSEAHQVAGPLHFGTNHLPDQDGAYGLNAYRTADGWLLMTLGLSELFSKVSEEPAVSGWGFELTMRLPAVDSEEAPPGWALNLLLKLSEYVFVESRPFAVGHRMQLGEPITGDDSTRLTAVALTADPALPALTTPNGAVEFLTVVGVTVEELTEMQETSTAEVIARLREASPSLVTDPAR